MKKFFHKLRWFDRELARAIGREMTPKVSEVTVRVNCDITQFHADIAELVSEAEQASAKLSAFADKAEADLARVKAAADAIKATSPVRTRRAKHGDSQAAHGAIVADQERD